MKKKLLSLFLAICLVFPCAILMTACGKKAYSVSGKTFELTENIIFVWNDDVTDTEKSQYLTKKFGEGVTEEKAIEELKKDIEDISITLTFNEDGSLSYKQSYKDNGETKTEEETKYYSQSEDNKEIKIYAKKDYTADTDVDEYILFRDGSFYLPYGSYNAESTVNILVELKKK